MESVRYVLNGSQIWTTQEFFDAVGEAVGGPGTYFGANLDAFSDCLRGGFGTPEDRSFYFVLKGSSSVRDRLGVDATIEWVRDKLVRGNPHNANYFLLEIDELERGTGRTLFDILLEIFDERKVRLELR
ncbi:MAG TPA: barstar family protein [Galbitalea sp.]